MKKGIRVLLVLIMVALSAVSCKTAEFGYKVYDINGMIYDFANRPVAYCEISMGIRGFNSTSDINGRFSIPRVPIGNHTLTVHKDGYEEYSEDFFIKQRGQIIYVRLPSQNQLLDMVDEALAANNFLLAEEIAERALKVDPNSIETLFYFATVKYRQHDYSGALAFLETAGDLDPKDPYIDKFMARLKEMRNENY